jgi:hypothetical protein
VHGLLTSLDRAGLIEIASVTEEADEPVRPLESVKPSSFSRTKPTPAVPDSQSFSSTIASQAAAQAFAPTRAADSAWNAQAEQSREQDLRYLVQEMSIFVLKHVPEQAFGVLAELEQTTSMEQMAVLLGGYELMVKHLGEPAQTHLAHLKQVLGQWM